MKDLIAVVRETNRKIEAIAAERVRSGVPLYDAIYQARQIYQAAALKEKP